MSTTSITLNNGVEMPALGLGVFQTPPHRHRGGSSGSTLQDPVIGEIAHKHGKTPAQVILRWHLQQGRSVIPKSTRPQRIAENIDVFAFTLDDAQLAAIDALDTGRRGGPEPSDITLEAFGRPIPEE